MAGRGYQSVGADVDPVGTPSSQQARQALFQPPTHLTEAQRGALLTTFIVISYLTAATSVLCAFSVIYYMVVTFVLDDFRMFTGDALVHDVVLLYGLVLCVVIAFVELEWTQAIRSLTVLQSWTVRGLVYVFVALVVFQEMGSFSATMLVARNLRIVQLPSVALFGFGVLYALMGVLCLKRVRDSKMARYIQLLSHLEVQAVVRRNSGPNRSSASVGSYEL